MKERSIGLLALMTVICLVVGVMLSCGAGGGGGDDDDASGSGCDIDCAEQYFEEAGKCYQDPVDCYDQCKEQTPDTDCVAQCFGQEDDPCLDTADARMHACADECGQCFDDYYACGDECDAEEAGQNYIKKEDDDTAVSDEGDDTAIASDDASDECWDKCGSDFDECMGADSDCFRFCHEHTAACEEACNGDVSVFPDLCFARDCWPNYSACQMSCYRGETNPTWPENNTDDDTDMDDDDTSAEDVWTDSSSGLMWQKSKYEDEEYGWHAALDYCANLIWVDYNDWRLPTISELRTLIRGCEATMTGGSCGVTDTCLDVGCQDDSCYNFCELHEGPNNGCYGTSKLSLLCDGYWSSSLVAGDAGNAWYVDFSDGGVWRTDINDEFTSPVVCVRGL